MIDAAIARSARRLRLLVFVGIAAIALLYVLGRFAPDLGPLRVEAQAAAPVWLGLGIADLTLLLFITALLRLAQMLGAIARGSLFAPQVTKAFRGFAFWLFIATLVDVVAGPALAILQLLRDGDGQTALVFELRDLLMLAGALFLFLLARIMERARAIEAELEAIV